MPAAIGGILIINFDVGISSVTMFGTTITTSGGQISDVSANDGTTYTGTFVLNSGYAIDSIVFNGDINAGTLSGYTDNDFSIVGGVGGISGVLTITTKEATDPYTIKIKNKEGIILKTANKLCTENITLVLDESLFENNGNEEQSGYTLTLICDSNTLNNSGYTYSIDGGSAYSEFTSTSMILENVTSIIFKEGNAGLYRLWIGTSSGYNDVANLLGGEETVNIDSDKTLYVYAKYDAGGYD